MKFFKRKKKEQKLVHRPKILSDKLGRIYAIVWEDNNSYVTPQEFKETLNMFRGRQAINSSQDCMEYLKLSLAKQSGDIEASKEMDHLHLVWNRKYYV